MAVDSDDKRPDEEGAEGTDDRDEREEKDERDEEKERAAGTESAGDDEAGGDDSEDADDEDEDEDEDEAGADGGDRDVPRPAARGGGGGGAPPESPGLRFLAAYGPSSALLVGLLAIFLGQRPFSHIDALQTILTAGGGLLVLGAMAVRTLAFVKASGKQRQIEISLLACYAGVLLALLVYVLGTKTGVDILGITEDKSVDRWQTATTVGWAILMGVSLIPLILVEATIGYAGRHAGLLEHKTSGAAVEVVRIKEAIANGLTIGLALSFLMVTCNVANERNVRKDVSYFKTSSPGTATQNITKSLNQTLRVMLFFPDVNEVADEVTGYFETLDADTGKVKIERYDNLVDLELAKKYKVTRPGSVVLVLGEKDEKFTLDPDIEKARRSQLRELDSKVQKALYKVVRAKRIAYLTVGHGELNDRGAERTPPAPVPGLDKASAIKTWLRNLNYRVKTFDGLGKPVPEDASILLVLAPMSPFMPAELDAIDDYLKNGGAVLFALDPQGEFSLGSLSGRLGVKFRGEPLADDKNFARLMHKQSDHQFIVTNQVSSHAAVTIAGRARASAPLVFLRPGSLADAPFTVKNKPKRTYVLRSMDSAWRDLDGDFSFDGGTEKRQRYNLMAAVEDPKASTDKPADAALADRGMRAIVISDAEVFSDAFMQQRRFLTLSQALVIDAIKWLGGEEQFSGETQSEKDHGIVHTKNEDVLWYYATIVGAPLVVLVFGLGFVFWRRRWSQRRRRSS